MATNEKFISQMIELVNEELTTFTKQHNIDTIVNAANPTLMGSPDAGVDYSIHEAIDNTLYNRTFNDLIQAELDQPAALGEHAIRCRRGEAVITSGGNFCHHVLHVVGPEYDGFPFFGLQKRTCPCSSSCIQELESCYQQIIEQVRKHSEIKDIAIPIISSGNYGFPFRKAVQVALASLGNALLAWKKSDPELFNQAAISKIYVCIYNSNAAQSQLQYQEAYKIWKTYMKVFIKDEKVVYQFSAMAQVRYFYEIIKNDRNRGYFAIAKIFRLVLLLIRFIFTPVLLLKDIFGQHNWQTRRTIVEVTVFLKLIFPIICYLFYIPRGFMIPTIIYFMTDTLTYLLVLIVLSDIQRPSANVIRSMIFLFVNYLEVSADLAILYYMTNTGSTDIYQSISFGLMPDSPCNFAGQPSNIWLCYLNHGAKFFFMTLAFGYFTNHLHQRKFVS